jgi:fructan beta-fructosidase
MNRTIAIAAVAAALCAGEVYREAFRPQFHFSPRINWTNDPCGIVYSNGEYHLFFQYNPVGALWGHMSWGHAVSRDLIRWNELPVAIPEGDDAMIFTGSSVVDKNNTSGLCKPGTLCIVSIYTGHTPKTETRPQRQAQHLAASQDGRTWTKYQGNPVLDIGLADFRDPKVFWHAPSKQWVMIVVLAREKKASLYGSPNLKDWKRLSDFGPEGATGGVWECPELFELPVDGDRHNKRWVLKIGLNPGHIAGGSGEQYFVGKFDGARFQNDNAATELRWLDYGRDCYCALTWSGEPQTRHMIGWMNNWQYARTLPTNPWRGAMTLPRTLELRSTSSGVRLFQAPVPGLRALRTDAFRYQGSSAAELNRKLAQRPNRTQTVELEAEIRPGAAKQVTWKLLEGADDYTVVGFDAVSGQLFVDRTKSASTSFNERYPSKTVAPLPLGQRPLRLRIFVDRSSIEVFAGDGEVVLTNLVFPRPDSTGISITSDGGEIDHMQVKLWNLRSIWSTL